MYVKKEDVYNVLTDYYHHRTEFQHETLKHALSQVPAACVKEDVKGEWLDIEVTEDYHVTGICSVCMSERRRISNFCPDCGAEMSEEKV